MTRTMPIRLARPVRVVDLSTRELPGVSWNGTVMTIALGGKTAAAWAGRRTADMPLDVRTMPPEIIDRLREAQAWYWLLTIPRFPWEGRNWRKEQNQVIVRLHPGALNARFKGQPLVKVSVEYPGMKTRVSGSGNSLAEAVERLSRELWRNEIKIPGPNWRNFDEEWTRGDDHLKEE